MRRPFGIFPLAVTAALVAVAFFSAPRAYPSGGDVILTIAGNGVRGSTGDGGQATEATLNRPRSIFATSDGGYVWAQPYANMVRKVGPDGIVTRVAGNGVAGYSGDGGPATAASLNFVHGVAPTADGGYLLADELNNRIRRVSPSGIITTVAGTGGQGYSGDGGPATAAQINNPRGVVAMPDGGFLFPDSSNNRVRRVWPNGTITTVAGTGVKGFAGDGGPATAAQLSTPFGVSPTSDGGFLIVDFGNQRIRKVAADGTITTVAGNGVEGYGGDGGPATAASLSSPHNVVALSDGSFFIADLGNNRVRRVDSAGMITTIAGTGVSGFSGDGGPATSAQLANPKAVGIDAAGNLLIADEQNDRIRFVGTPVGPANTLAPSISGPTTQGRTLKAAAGGWSGTGPSFTYQWQRCDPAGASCADVSGAVGTTFVLGSADVGSTLRVLVTGSNIVGSSSAVSAATAIIAPTGDPPLNTSPPTITGTPQDGQTLTADEGTWTGTLPLTYTYQWQRCNSSGAACANISGAVAKTYVATPSDVGATLQVTVTASNSGGSRYAAAVLADSPVSYWRLGETGGTLVDQQTTANGLYVGSPQQAVSGLLTGDTDPAVTLNGTSQYLEIPADPRWTPAGGFSIEVLVRPSALPVNRTIAAAQGTFNGWWLNTGPSGELRLYLGDGAGWRSGPVGPVLQPSQTYDIVATYNGTLANVYVNGALVSTGPTVAMVSNVGAAPLRFGSASAGVGQFWPGTIDDASFYSTALGSTQVQAHYGVAVTGSAGTSSPTAVVAAAPPANISLPAISGTAQVGQTLTGTSGGWSGTSPFAYTYQWRRCDSSGGTCADISGATQTTYAPVQADVGSTIRLTVTATNAAGSASADSAQTGAVTPQATSGTLTFSLTSGADDGYLQQRSPVSGGYPPTGSVSVNTTGTFSAAGRRREAGNYYSVIDGLLRFDTSALPDGATVTSATLKLDVTGKASADGRSLQAEWYPASNWPIDAADFSLDSSGSALAGAAIGGIATGQVDSFSLTGLSDISDTGSTGLRLHVSGGVPTGDNYVTFASFESGSLPAPQLVVDYTLGTTTAPVSTSAPTISNVAQVGQTLSGSSGGWSGTSPVAHSFAWRRCDSSGGSCADISGATQTTYAPVQADVGSTLKLSVTASNSAGSASADSAPTTVVSSPSTSGTLIVSVLAGADDGYLQQRSPTSGGYPPTGSVSANTTGTLSAAGRRLESGNYSVIDGLLRFDTSALPDGATVTSATLKLDVTGKANADSRALQAEWYPASSWPIDAADFSLDSSGSALAGADLAGIAVGQVDSFSLGGLGSISTTGYTGLRLHVSGGVPTGDNYVQFAAYEHATLPEAQLVIAWTVP